MELYDKTSSAVAKLITRQYSTSFASASRLFSKELQPHIYNIYGLVRIADEIVDTYRGVDQKEVLLALESECSAAMLRHYSVNPVVHAFARTANTYSIREDLLEPFFESMHMDITGRLYDQETYDKYIHGSAEVIGLMCLRIFCGGDEVAYANLAPGAQRLGAAYQKVNFLRDIAADHRELGRFYFPGYTFETFDTRAKAAVTTDIRQDFAAALRYIEDLPIGARAAVKTSYRYYEMLLSKLEKTNVEIIKQQRVRLSNYQKALLTASQLRGVRL